MYILYFQYVYKVKWKGYPIEESTWEPPEHFNDTSILKAYHDQLKKRRQVNFISCDSSYEDE